MRFSFFALSALAIVGLAACKKPEGATTPPPPTGETAQPASAPAKPAAPVEAAAAGKAVEKITAKIEARSGSSIGGDITLTPTADGVHVLVNITGGKGETHAVHIHQNADCSAPDGKSAGDHFNPDNHQHGLPEGPEKHLGDLGNVKIGDDGTAKIDTVVTGANLTTGDPHSFVSRGLIVHEKADDGGQPTGNAGARWGCAELKAN